MKKSSFLADENCYSEKDRLPHIGAIDDDGWLELEMAGLTCRR